MLFLIVSALRQLRVKLKRPKRRPANRVFFRARVQKSRAGAGFDRALFWLLFLFGKRKRKSKSIKEQITSRTAQTLPLERSKKIPKWSRSKKSNDNFGIIASPEIGNYLNGRPQFLLDQSRPSLVFPMSAVLGGLFAAGILFG